MLQYPIKEYYNKLKQKKLNNKNKNNIENLKNIDDNFEYSNIINNYINEIFRKINDGEINNPSIIIQCKSNDKISDIIQKYRRKSGDNDTDIKFIFNFKILTPFMKLYEVGIINNANIFVAIINGVKGLY